MLGLSMAQLTLLLPLTGQPRTICRTTAAVPCAAYSSVFELAAKWPHGDEVVNRILCLTSHQCDSRLPPDLAARFGERALSPPEGCPCLTDYTRSLLFEQSSHDVGIVLQCAMLSRVAYMQASQAQTFRTSSASRIAPRTSRSGSCTLQIQRLLLPHNMFEGASGTNAVGDPLLQTWFNAARRNKPQTFKAAGQSAAAAEQVAAEDTTGGPGGSCDFCNWSAHTAVDTFGRQVACE